MKKLKHIIVNISNWVWKKTKQNFFSLVALTISIYTFAQQNLNHFKLQMKDLGHIGLMKSYRDTARIGISLDVISENLGFEKGIVDDIALILENSNDTIVLNAIYENKDVSISYTKDPKKPNFEPFVGFQLNKEETIVKHIMFEQRDDEAPFSFTAGLYDVKIFAHSTENKEWKLMNTIKIELNSNDIVSINNATRTPLPDGGFWVTFTELIKPTSSVEERRKSLREVIQ